MVAQHPPVPKATPHHALVRDGVHAVGPPGAGRLEPRHLGVGEGQDVHHPGQGGRRRQVRPADASVRMRAAQHPGVEQIGEAHSGGHIVGVQGAPRSLLQAVDPGTVGPDETTGLPGGEGLAHGVSPAMASAACATAWEMPA